MPRRDPRLAVAKRMWCIWRLSLDIILAYAEKARSLGSDFFGNFRHPHFVIFKVDYMG